MLRHRRVAMVAGLVSALVALVLPFAVTSPASALTNNVVSVTKVVNGTPTQAGDFEVVVECTDGVAVSIQTLVFPPTGGSSDASFLPAFTDCTVRETQTRGADASSIQATSPTAVIVVPNGNDATVPVSITFDPPGAMGQTANVGITNTFIPRNPNVVNVTKSVVGDAPPGAFFQITVNCGGDDVDLLFTAAGGTKSASFPSTDVGACAVDETLASPGLGPVPGLQQVSYNPGQNLGAFTSGPGGGQTKAVTVTNRYAQPGPTNTISVTKRVRGRVPAGVTGFSVRVTCAQTPGDPVNNPNVLPPLTHVFPVTGGTFDFEVSKEYRDCDVVETPVPNGAAVDYQAVIGAADGTLRANSGPNDVKLRFNTGGDNNASVTVTNRYPGDNTLNITKELVGQVPPGSLFLVRVDCDNNFDGDPANNTSPGPNAIPPNPAPPVDGSVFLLFGEGQPSTQQVFDVEGPNGSTDSCYVREVNTGGATAVNYSAVSESPQMALIVIQPPPATPSGAYVFWPPTANQADSASVTITNRFAPCPDGSTKCSTEGPLPTNEIRVKKRIRGDAPNPPSFTIRLRCFGDGLADEYQLTFTDQTPQSIDVPANRNFCVLKETDNGGASTVEYFAAAPNSATADATFGTRSARVEFDTTGGDQARLRVTNRFPGRCPAGPPRYC